MLYYCNSNGKSTSNSNSNTNTKRNIHSNSNRHSNSNSNTNTNSNSNDRSHLKKCVGWHLLICSVLILVGGIIAKSQYTPNLPTYIIPTNIA